MSFALAGAGLIHANGFTALQDITLAATQGERIALIGPSGAGKTSLLSLIGVDARHPMIGRDLTQEPDGLPGRAMMQYEQNYAWMEGRKVVVLRPDKAPSHGTYDPAHKRLESAATPVDAQPMEQRALAHALLGAWLYRDQLYRLPE